MVQLNLLCLAKQRMFFICWHMFGVYWHVFVLTDPDPDITNNYTVLPCIKGLTEPLTRILKRYDIRVTNKPLRTLEQEFPSPKDRPSTEKQTNVVYKIDCMNCSWCYIGETGRCFET